MNHALTISVKIIKKKCQQVFPIDSTVFMCSGENLLWPRSRIVDVIFLGNAPNLISQKSLWPPDIRIRLWTLCTSHKKLLTELYHIPSEVVGVVPRSLIYPPNKKMKPFPPARNFTLVYSGRLNREKNFLLVAEVASLLQQSNAQMDFVICGPLGLKEQEALPKLLKKFKWKTPPVIKGDLGSSWAKKIKGNPILLNLSTYLQEDFGVSVAEAQHKGWPLILSQWGGHLDVRGSNSVKIPARYILNSDAQAIADLCLRRESDFSPAKRESFKKPKTTTYREIETLISRIPQKKVLALQKLFSDEVEKPVLPRALRNQINAILSGEH